MLKSMELHWRRNGWRSQGAGGETRTVNAGAVAPAPGYERKRGNAAILGLAENQQ